MCDKKRWPWCVHVGFAILRLLDATRIARHRHLRAVAQLESDGLARRATRPERVQPCCRFAERVGLDTRDFSTVDQSARAIGRVQGDRVLVVPKAQSTAYTIWTSRASARTRATTPWLRKPPAFAPPSASGDDQFEILGVLLLRVATRKRVSGAGTANPFGGIIPLALATGCVYNAPMRAANRPMTMDMAMIGSWEARST